uniref:Knr4/Smi1-like domain-containing protein n=1 Tax=Ailuropoda melanoleuca TaxID=9646 RepID=A0A7N5JMV7_AILME
MSTPQTYYSQGSPGPPFLSCGALRNPALQLPANYELDGPASGAASPSGGPALLLCPHHCPSCTRSKKQAMQETMPSGYSKPHLEKLTLAINCILESFPCVTGVTIKEKPPAEHHLISSWEQKSNYVLPKDVKNFYLMTNGFHMTWSVNMVINSISKLTQLNQSSVYSLPNAPTVADLEFDALEANNGIFPSSQKVLLGRTALEYFHAALSQISFSLENVDTLI